MIRLSEIYVENQPIFTKVLNVINNKSKFHQAYILVKKDKKKLDESLGTNLLFRG